MQEQNGPSPEFIPASPEVTGENRGDLEEAQRAKVEALFSAAELRSPDWALDLRAQYAADPRAVEEIAEAIDLDVLSGLKPSDKISK